jgi:hypothetical protein
MPASTHLGNAILNEALRGVAYTPPTRVYISLHTSDPGNNGIDEVSVAAWPAYQRQDPAGGGAVGDGFAAASSKATTNAADIEFGANDGAGPVTVTHFGIWDAATSGNFLVGGALTDSKVIAPTDEMIIRTGNLTVEVDGS